MIQRFKFSIVVALCLLLGMDGFSQSIQFTYENGKRVGKTVGLSQEKEIEGDTLINDLCEHIYSIPEFPNHVYTWEVNGGEIISGQETSEIAVKWFSSGYVSASEVGTQDDSCPGVYTLPVTVEARDSVIALFQADTLFGLSPLTVNFENQSTGQQLSYLWDLGDGNTAIEQNPVHEYLNPGEYTVQLTVSEGCDTSFYERVDYIEVISFSDTSQAPVATNVVFEIEENVATGTSVGAVQALDPNGDDLTYDIILGNELMAFELDSISGLLTVADSVPLDYEVNPEFNLSVEVSDGALSDTASVVVQLTDVFEMSNVAPAVSDTTFTINELSATGTLVGMLNATDENEDLLTYSILSGNELGAFNMDDATGGLYVADSALLDHESTATFELSVEVTDAELSSTALVTVVLTNINERPIFSVSTGPISLDENENNGTVLAQVSATDPEEDAVTLFIIGGNDLGVFELHPVSGNLFVADASLLDYETNPNFLLTIEASDGELTATELIDINLNDLNEAPYFTQGTASVAIPENPSVNEAVAGVAAIDPEGDPLTFTILFGNDLGAFDFDTTTGQLIVADSVPLDYELNTSFQLVIEVKDSEFSVTETIDIQLEDVNEAPVISLSTAAVNMNENPPTGVAIANAVATDPDSDELTFAIVSGNDSGAFDIDVMTGQLIVADPIPLNFEVNPVFNLILEAMDTELFDTASIEVTLNDINDAPYLQDTTFTLAGSAAVGAFVGTASAIDEDGDEITYAILSGSGRDVFTIEPQTGEISVASTTAVNLGTINSLEIEIQVTDRQLVGFGLVTVNLSYQELGPTIERETFQIKENTAVDVFVGQLTASDPNGDPLTFEISGEEAQAFRVDAMTGELFVANSALLDFEKDNILEFEAIVYDDKLNSDNALIRVELEDELDNPLSVSDGVGGTANVYPNPTDKQLNIDWDKYEYAMVRDMLGRTIFQSTEKSINVVNLRPGNYIIILYGKNGELRLPFTFIKK